MTGNSLLLAIAATALLAAPHTCLAQTQSSTPQAVQASTPAHRHRRHRTGSAIQRIPIEQQTTASGTPDVTAAQRAADAQLLRQQEARSAHDAQVNDQQVQKLEQQQAAQASQQRIQDTPGPSQSVLVPGYPPVVGTSATPQRIDDAPGPVPVAPAPQM